MKARELAKLGVPPICPATWRVMAVREARRNGTSKDNIRQMLRAVVAEPEKIQPPTPQFGKLAEGYPGAGAGRKAVPAARRNWRRFQIWGRWAWTTKQSNR